MHAPGIRFVNFCFVGLATTLWAGSIVSPARACSVCQPGDPVFSSEGATAQQVGAFNFYLETLQIRKKSGAMDHHAVGHAEGAAHEEEGPHVGEAGAGEHPHEEGASAGVDTEENVSRETWLYASWAPTDRVTLTAALPYKWISIEEQPFGARSVSSRNSGFGDFSLYATTVLWRNRNALPSSWLEGRLMLKAPTGKRSERVDSVLDPHLQLGTGSWDWGLGLAGTHRVARGSVYGSLFYRFNSKGSLDYEYGDVFLGNVAWMSDAFEFGPLSRSSGVRGGAELNFRYAGRDDFRGASYDHSGGSIFYASPFLEMRLGPDHLERVPWMRLGGRIPLGNGGLNGEQSEGYVFSLGFRLGF